MRARCRDNDDDNSSTTTERCAHDNYVVRDKLNEVRNMRVILRFKAQTKGNEFNCDSLYCTIMTISTLTESQNLLESNDNIDEK